MFILMALVFVLGYLAIALEHPLKINKAASAILTGAVVWTILMLGQDTIFPPGHGGSHFLNHRLVEHLGEIGSILFFLMGAMTIVELVDVHEGFRVITDRITTKHKVKLLWVICVLAFFMSAALDNLTTTIVMCALLRKLIADKETQWLFAGMVVISANAGGAWSPIGDITTIMLWIGGQVTTVNIIAKLIVPSLVCLILPLLWMSPRMKGAIERPAALRPSLHHGGGGVTSFERNLVFVLGVGALVFVPIFKGVTHLPPFMGVMLGLGILWVVTEFIHWRHGVDKRGDLMVTAVLRRIDMPSVLFFLGILVAVAGLQEAGHLGLLAEGLDRSLGNIYFINGAIGVLSSIVDNVPLVAGAMGMYPMTQYPPDHLFWELLALCAGTGGSLLIIGSAAGVAAMGIMHIDFIWYIRKMTIPAAIGYLGGMLTFYLMFH
jgi:Na+/H+ antiporter NhaD/arsenite permease-like protein